MASRGRGRGERGGDQWSQRERGQRYLIIKANYCSKKGGERNARNLAIANIRYIAHRRDRQNGKVTRELFGFDGTLSKQTAYQMVHSAPEKRRYYYRIIISPDPRREDKYKDLDLKRLTISTMLKLEERYGTQIQLIAAIHDDHSPHRHVHTLVILNGRRLTREDFASIRAHARNRSLTQRRVLDRRRRLELLGERSRSYRPPFVDGGNISSTRAHGHSATTSHIARYYARRDSAKGRFYAPAPRLCSYLCPVCGRYSALPYSRTGYRCLADGTYLQRERPSERVREKTRERGLALELAL